MGGKILEFEATRIHDKALNEGRKEGRKEGREKGAIMERIEVLRDYGESDEKIIKNVCARFKISEEEAKKYMELQKKSDPLGDAAKA